MRQTAARLGRHAGPAGAGAVGGVPRRQGSGIFQAAVPANWTQPHVEAVRSSYVPQNGYGQFNGQMVFTPRHRVWRGEDIVAEPSGRDTGVAEGSG